MCLDYVGYCLIRVVEPALLLRMKQVSGEIILGSVNSST